MYVSIFNIYIYIHTYMNNVGRQVNRWEDVHALTEI